MVDERGVAVLDRDMAVERMGGDEELYDEIVEVFFEDVPVQLEILWTAFREGDQVTAERQTHSLKSAAGNIGAELMRTICFEGERAFRSRDCGEAKLESLCQEIDGAFQQLKQLFRKI